MLWYFSPRKDGINLGFRACVAKKATAISSGSRAGMVSMRISVGVACGMSPPVSPVSINLPLVERFQSESVLEVFTNKLDYSCMDVVSPAVKIITKIRRGGITISELGFFGRTLAARTA